MDIIGKLGTNSAIYAATNLLQKGASFLLMPLYTLYLDPSAYGVLSIVTAINGLLSIAFTLGLTSAVTRFYFEYQRDPDQLAEFWGSILAFVLLLSALVAGALLALGDLVLRPLIGEVAFWPYVALGVLAAFFQPFFTTFLTVLQTRNEARRYAVISLAHFALTTLLTLALVVVLGWGVVGALIATLAAAAVFFVVSLWLLRADLKLCLRWRHLRPAFAYSLPQVPHSIASQVTAITDRLILNGQLGAATAGLYSVGAMVAMVVEVAAQSVNRAYVPLSMAQLKSGHPRELDQLRAVGALVVGGFCLVAATIGVFGHELVWLLASPSFAQAAAVIPILAYCGVASSIYYLLVNVLFFDRSAIKLLPIGSLSAAGLNVSLALMLVPRFGMQGAAVSTLLAQTLATILIASIARRFDPIRWDYGRYAIAFGAGFIWTLMLSRLNLGGVAVTLLAKLLGLALLSTLLGALFWSRPLILFQASARMLSRRPAEAAALFVDRPGAIS